MKYTLNQILDPENMCDSKNNYTNFNITLTATLARLQETNLGTAMCVPSHLTPALKSQGTLLFKFFIIAWKTCTKKTHEYWVR